jgi:homoserine kinase
MMKRVRAYAPATVGNVSCGFDVFGLAVERPGDEVDVVLRDEPGVVMTGIEGEFGHLLPMEADRNTAGVAVGAFLESIGFDRGVGIRLFKGMPLGSGMGSSAASACAALWAANRLVGSPLSKQELLPFAVRAEEVACGAGHADNVSPSLLGGFVLIRRTEPLDVVSLPVPEAARWVLIHPDVVVNTAEARRRMRSEVALGDVVTQLGNVGSFLAGMLTGDVRRMGDSMEDVIAEPARGAMIPCFGEAKRAALEAGALGCGISGSGPSMVALADNDETAEAVGAAMGRVFAEAGIAWNVYVSGTNVAGARIVLEE